MRPLDSAAFVMPLIVFVTSVLYGTSQAPSYVARQTGDIVQLQDTKAQTTVSVKPSAGNVAFEMVVKGHNVLNFSGTSAEDFKGGLTGIPFVGPWANRLDEQAFYANGKKYAFDMQLGNVRGAIPIHGLGLASSNQWQVVEVKADNNAAWVTSKLEFYKNPMWMKQFPFAHTVEMTYRLQDGVLEVRTKITNLSLDPMPVAIGFHPYFQLTDTPRSDWTISVGARTHWLLASTKVPTGETEPVEKRFADPTAVPLKDYDIDDVFSDLVRDQSGRATMTVRGTKSQQVDVMLGQNYRSVVIWAPNPAVVQNAAGRSGQPASAASPTSTALPQTAPAVQNAAPQPNAVGSQTAAAPANAAANAQAGRGGRGGGAQTRNFVCFEPMAGITDAMNLAQKGLYAELQSIPPGGAWQESFWIRPKGF